MIAKKRIISLLIAVFMVLAMLPMTAQEANAYSKIKITSNGYVYLGGTVSYDFSKYDSTVKEAELELSNGEKSGDTINDVSINGTKISWQAPSESYYAGFSATINVTLSDGREYMSEEIMLVKSLDCVDSIPNMTYTGKPIKHTKLVYDYYDEYEDVVTCALGRDFTITYKNNLKVGRATAILTGRGYYRGTKKLYFNIRPKGTTAKAPKKGKKSFTARWTRQKTKMNKARITGYQVQYSTDKKFKANVYNKYVKGYKKKKIYYVRIRTYMSVGGKYYYSTWSKVKAVKTK